MNRRGLAGVRMARAAWATVATLAGLTAAGCSSPTAQEPPDADRQARLDRGRYMVTIGGCNDCHTPLKMGANGPEPDMSRMLSGHPETMAITQGLAVEGPWLGGVAMSGSGFSGPWGVSFAANLTPDENTGIGIWTEDMFMQTIRTGRHWGVARPILPPMPWFNYKEMTDEDLRAVYAYLRTIPAVKNRVPDPLPPGAPQRTKNEASQSAPLAH